MKITIEVIDHPKQRYDTAGDWQFDGEDLHIRVSDLGDWKLNFLLAQHELNEAMMCKLAGITQEMVDGYDLSHPEAGGDDLSSNANSPYFVQHNTALCFEFLMARMLKVDWKEYSNKLEELNYGNETKVGG